MDTLLVFLGLFFGLCLLVRVPAAFSLGIGALAAFAYSHLPMSQACQAMYNQLDSFPFIAIPMFILAGAIMEKSKISEALIDWIQFFVGKVRGALGFVTIIASAAFGVITGSAMATISAIGRIMGPSLEKNGYKKPYIGALLAACGFLGIMIPPSIPGIMYATAAGEKTSEIWASTIGPGLLFVILYCIINYLKVGRFETKQEGEKMKVSRYFQLAGQETLHALPAILMPVIIFGGIYSGVFTPTEAGAVSCVYGLVYILVKSLMKKSGISLNTLYSAAISAGISTGTVCILAAFANTAGRAITLAGVSNALTNFIVTNINNKYIYLLLVNVIYLFAGTFLECNCAILILVPLLLPPARALGIDAVHFGAITLVNLSVGNLTPPFAQGIFMSAKVVGASFVEITKEIMPFLIVSLLVIILVTYVPGISLLFV